MSKQIYYNTKTTATIELTEAAFNNLNPKIKSKYRAATAAETKLHEDRLGQSKRINDRRQRIKKNNDTKASAKVSVKEAQTGDGAKTSKKSVEEAGQAGK